MRSVPRLDAEDYVRYAPPLRGESIGVGSRRQVEDYLENFAVLEGAHGAGNNTKDADTPFKRPQEGEGKPAPPLRYLRKEVVVGERYEVLKGEEVVPTFVGPMLSELYRFEC